MDTSLLTLIGDGLIKLELTNQTVLMVATGTNNFALIQKLVLKTVLLKVFLMIKIVILIMSLHKVILLNLVS